MWDYHSIAVLKIREDLGAGHGLGPSHVRVFLGGSVASESSDVSLGEVGFVPTPVVGAFPTVLVSFTVDSAGLLLFFLGPVWELTFCSSIVSALVSIEVAVSVVAAMSGCGKSKVLLFESCGFCEVCDHLFLEVVDLGFHGEDCGVFS